MKSTLKSATLERLLPILSVEEGCIISKDADLTVVFRVELPPVFTLSEAEYAQMHSAWVKAIRVLPDYTVLHKQDWFVEKQFAPKAHDNSYDRNDSFLSRSFERHFFERPVLTHSCYLFLTKTTKERIRSHSDFSILCRGNIIPKEATDNINAERFLEAVSQAESILRESGLMGLHRLTSEEIAGSEHSAGIIERYLSLSMDGNLDSSGVATLQDISIEPHRMFIGNKELSLHTLSDLDNLPSSVAPDGRYERLSTDKSDCRLSFASPVGVLLPHNHIYNQYVFLENSADTLKRFEALSRNMLSLSKYSRSNGINREWIEEYLNEAHSYGLRSVRCHCNILSWSEAHSRLPKMRNDTGSALTRMGCKPHHNTVDVPTLFWAGIPGGEGGFPAEESFYTFAEQAACLFSGESIAEDSPSPFGIRLADRLTGRPLYLDISDLPLQRGIITNRNKFILGTSGSGKSFFTNHIVRQYYEQGAHIVLVDTGNSYKGLCSLINEQTAGRDGLYFTYTEEQPISFNPFYSADRVYDIEKRESIKTLILSLWKRNDQLPTRAEEVAVSNAVSRFLMSIQSGAEASFNGFYEYVSGAYREELRQRNVREKEFDIDNFLNVLEPYYRGGEYDYLLNNSEQQDLLSKRFIVFELDNIKEHKVLFPVVTIIIMETYIGKMRHLEGVRKVILIEEAWKAIAKEGMADYIKYLFKTVRKYFGEAIIVTQEVDDIISSPIVKESIINNSDCKILLDERKYLNKFDRIQSLLGLTDKERAQILSINLANDPSRRYKEVWIGLGGTVSSVYAVEVSEEEYLAYTTEERERVELNQAVKRLGGDIQLAIRTLAEQKRDSRASGNHGNDNTLSDGNPESKQTESQLKTFQ